MAPTTRCYRAQIASDRRAAARERATAIVAADNARIEFLYTDDHAMIKHAARRSGRRPSLPREMVVYPEFDFAWAARG